MLIRGCVALLCWLLVSPVWAFPDNGVLDTFTGSDGTTPPNSNWTNAELRDGGNGGGLVIQDNAVSEPVATGGTWGGYWDTTSFNADCEAYVEFVSTLIGSASVYCRIANPGTNTTDGYEVRVLDGTSLVEISRIDNGVATLLGAQISQAIDVNDQFGIRTVGDQICAWFNNDGAGWVELGCRTDATYSAGGFIGLSVSDSSDETIGKLDNFGGGNVAAAATILQSPPVPPVVFQ